MGFTVYDATYVYYARNHGAKLITCSKEMITKASNVALSLREWFKNINNMKH
jgi:predicted nucleic acid-binding protein